MKNVKNFYIKYLIISILMLFFIPTLLYEFNLPVGLLVSCTIMLFFNLIISIIALVIAIKYNTIRNATNKNYTIFKNTNDSKIKDASCNNSCVEEGSDIFSEKREQGKSQFRMNKKEINKNKNNGKRYCIHCGAEIMYDNYDWCDWCGQAQVDRHDD